MMFLYRNIYSRKDLYELFTEKWRNSRKKNMCLAYMNNYSRKVFTMFVTGPFIPVKKCKKR